VIDLLRNAGLANWPGRHSLITDHSLNALKLCLCVGQLIEEPDPCKKSS
jgi:hypothetical protein